MGVYLGSQRISIYGGGGKPEEEKTVTAGTSVIEVNPSSGKVMKKVTVNPTPTESKSVTPTTSELTVTPSEGKHLSQVVVGAVEDVTPEVTTQTPLVTQILEGLVGKAQGANATADKILEGYSAYVGQELLEGTAKDLQALATMLGFTKIAVDEFICTETKVCVDSTINHSLGEIPKFVLLEAKIKPPTEYCNSICHYLYNSRLDKATRGFYRTYNPTDGSYESGDIPNILTKDTFVINYHSARFGAGCEYALITMA